MRRRTPRSTLTDAICPDSTLFRSGSADSMYWQTQRRAALAEGVIDASVALVMEGRRPSAQQSDYWIARWRSAIARSLDVLEGEVEALHGQIDAIASAAALGHLDLRHADLNRRDGRPALAAWYARFAQRPSMRDTEAAA